MKSAERKQEIIGFIERQKKAKTAEIFSFVQNVLNEDVDRVTVSRDLSSLVAQDVLQKEGKGPATLYLVRESYFLTKKVDMDVYFQKTQDEREVRTSFNFDIFSLLQVDIFTPAELEKLHALHSKFSERFDDMHSSTLIEKEFERIMIDFSWKSSQIEGNTYSLLDTEILIKDNKVAEGKSAHETQMILNHKNAFMFMRKNKDLFKSVNRAIFEETHKILVADLGITENLRSRAVGITGTNYKPLDNVHQVSEALTAMAELINTKIDFFEKAFLALLLTAYIQPFEDGNKRTARTVSNAILFAYDTIPLSYRTVNEVEYKKANLIFYESNNFGVLKEIFIQQFEFVVEKYF